MVVAGVGVGGAIGGIVGFIRVMMVLVVVAGFRLGGAFGGLRKRSSGYRVKESFWRVQ